VPGSGAGEGGADVNAKNNLGRHTTLALLLRGGDIAGYIKVADAMIACAVV
jgi:hypothetical protein